MRKGFTIVELLIVIVVIAILAAISVIAYNDVQQRAYNSKIITGVNAYYKALLNYRSVSGNYPTTSACLGINYPNNACWANNQNGSSPVLSVNSTVDANLSEFLGNTKPEIGVDMINIVVVNQFRSGAWIIVSGTVYSVTAPVLAYYLKGNNANCSMAVNDQRNEGPLTQCIIKLPT